MNQHHTPPPTPPDAPRDLLGAYAIGATDADEAARVREYLHNTPEAQADLGDAAMTAALMMAAVPRRDPPPALRDKLLQAARATSASQPTQRTQPVRPPAPTLQALPKVVSPPVQPPTARARTPWVAWVAGAAAAVLLFMNVYWMSEVNSLRARQADLERQSAEQVASLQAQSDAQLAQIEQIKQAEMNEAMTLMVSGAKAELMDDDGEMRAMVMWEPGQAEGVMFTHSLPSLDDTRTYQLWLIDEQGNPISAGTFTVDNDGRATLMFSAADALDAFAGLGISVEPMGGSPTPTTTPLALAQL
ncbi:MAG: anti-sigma factor [Anaerolineae bacterium]|nr:anti-sigma factor [Anaerolineae bacterium]